MVTYYELGKNKQLHEIVVAGTHDAGITGGGSGVQTQTLNILEQAKCGVRFFDIRIAAAVTSQTHASGRPVAELRAFHADDKVVMKLSLYTAGGNVNTKTLEDLRGKVVVLFSSSGLKELPRPTNGILGFKNLSALGASYERVYDGLQYYGKGRTSPFNPVNKTKQNIQKQSKLMQGAAALGNPEVIGMMYWTTTGLIESIKKRDDGMWDAPNVSKMKALWGQGLGDFVNARVSLPSRNPLARAQQRRSFFPNIVMIDFADDAKCRRIRDLNDLSPPHLAGVA